MASDHVLRLKRIDSEDFVLINITPIGPDLFDLRLSATEGANPFVTKLKHSRIAEYHSKKSPVSLNDWEKILEATLLQKRLEGPGRAVLGGIEVSATVIDDYVTIIFRKNVSGVKQRIGKISIQKDENHEIDTVGWVATAAARSEVLEKEIVDLKARFDEQNNVIQKLNEQLEDLIKTKKTHEESLFEKFRELLNTKKLKIRDQQRLLATSRVDPSKATQIQSIRASSTSTSRPLKRKSNKSGNVSASEDDGFEKTNADVDADDGDPGTPQKSDLEETSDEGGDLDPASPPTAKKENELVASRDDEEMTEDDDDDEL